MNKLTKIGILTFVGIIILVFGFAYLKGSGLFGGTSTYYAVYQDAEGLYPSDPVLINGFQVGKVKEISLMHNDLSKILVTLEIDEEINVPKNSIAILYNDGFLGDKSVKLLFEKSGEGLESGDTINTKISPDFSARIQEEIEPITNKLEAMAVTTEEVLNNINTLFDKEEEENLYALINSINQTANTATELMESLDRAFDPNTGQIAGLINSTTELTDSLKNTAGHINHLATSVTGLSDSLKSAQIGNTLVQARTTLDELNTLLLNLNEGEGSAALLIKDPALYDNLSAASKSLDELLSDLKDQPGRYVRFSVFGGGKDDKK